jgi:hypothetical protein
MPRCNCVSEQSLAAPVGPHTIVPTAVYNLATARVALSLAAGTLPREIRLRRLRASKRAGKYLILGAWLLEWVAAGEVHRGENSAKANSTSGDPAAN